MNKLLNELPKGASNMWLATKKIASKSHSESRAEQIAWSHVRSKFNKVENQWVAKSEDFEGFTTVHYEFKADEMSVSKSDDGFTTIDYVLSGNNKDSEGQAFGDFALKTMTAQINEEGLVGRINEDSHEQMKVLQHSGKTAEEVEEELQKLNTGIKAISAKYDNGKMIAKIRVSNDLVGQVLDYKGASIEARMPKESYKAGVFTQARATGFVFTNKPANNITGKVN